MMNRPVLIAFFILSTASLIPAPLLADVRDCIHYDDIFPDPGEWIFANEDSLGTYQVTVRDDIAYFSRVGDQLGFCIVDISDPYAPILMSTMSGFLSPRDIDLYENYCLLADKNHGVHIIDVSDPYNPEVHTTVDTPYWATGLAVQGEYAYVADIFSGLQIIDLSDIDNPSIVGSLNTPDQARDVVVEGDYAYIANKITGVIIADVSDPHSPSTVSTVDTSGWAWLISKEENFIFVGDRQGGAVVIDVTNPEQAFIVDVFDTEYEVHDIAIENGIAYLADVGFGIRVASVSDSGTLTEIGTLLANSGAVGLDATEGYLISTDYDTGYRIAPLMCGYYLVDDQGTGDFPDIQSAVLESPYYKQVKLLDGYFTGPGNRDINLFDGSKSISSLSGNPDSCIIDCQGTESEPHRGFLFQSGETSESVIEGITIIGGYADEGGAIKCENGSSPTIRNCVLRDNLATSGGAIYSDSSSPTIENCTISYNTSPIAGSAFLLYSDPIFENCILSHSIDGAAVFGYESNPLLSCTDVVWNEGGDWVGCISDQQNQNGNFSNTPAFCDPEDGDFRLQPGSPCLPEHNDCGALVGALGEGDCAPTGVEEQPSSARVVLELYPNPFNPHLTITFGLPTQAEGQLVVHDVTGRQVKVLGEGTFTQGANEIVWNGKDDQGQDVASGVYFVRLTTGKHQESRKVILLQ